MEPPQDGERFVELRRVGQGQDVIVAYHGPAAGHPDSAALQVLAGIMSGGGGGRGRARRRRRRRRPAHQGAGRQQAGRLGVDAGRSSCTTPAWSMLTASLNKDQSLDVAKKALIDTLEGIVKEPPTKDEVDRVKTGLLRNLERSLSDPQSLATGALNTAIAQGDWRLMFLQHDRLKDVTPDDLVRVAKTYFKASNRTVGLLHSRRGAGPHRRPRTPGPGRRCSEDYKSTVTITRGETFDPTPANIESARVAQPSWPTA